MTRILGVDPGASGAIALLDTTFMSVKVFDTPTGKAGPNGRTVIMDSILARHIKSFGEIDVAIIEDVHSMPRDGSSSAFKFGTAFGIIRGIVAANEIRTVYVTPAKWKGMLGLVGKDKDASRVKVLELFPRYANLFQRKMDHGRAEALLLAYLAYTGNIKV